MAEQYTQIVNFPPLAQGDTFQEHTINISVSSNMDLTDAEYCMVMKKQESTNVIIRDFEPVLDTLTDAQNAIVKIPSFNANYSPYNYVYGFKIIFSNGDKLYIYKGDFPIYSVIPNRCQ